MKVVLTPPLPVQSPDEKGGWEPRGTSRYLKKGKQEPTDNPAHHLIFIIIIMAKTKRQAKQTHQCRIETAATRVPGNPEPKPVIRALVQSYVAQLNLSIPTPGTPVSVTPALIAAAIPGGAGMWPRMRIMKYELYGNDGSLSTGVTSGRLILELTSNSGSEFGGDNAQFTDNGTIGARRAHIAVRPGMFQRLQWTSSTVATPVATVDDTVASVVILQVSVELRSQPLE